MQPEVQEDKFVHFGRPRTVTPSPEECIILGKDLIKWALEEDEKDPHILFQQWYCLKHAIIRKAWKSMVQCPEFLPYYEAAQSILSKRVLNETIDKSFGHRYLRLYDRDLIEAENDQARWDAELKKMSEEQIQSLLVKVINYADKAKDS